MAHIRKSAECMETDEWARLNRAIRRLFDTGRYAGLVAVHAALDEIGRTRHRMHGSMMGALGFMRFLPWHRAYLITFERALQEIEPAATIPYWDWPKSEEIPHQLIVLPGSARPIGRPSFTHSSEIEAILSQTEFAQFVEDLEVGPHNAGHNWIGGIMGNPMFSPRDAMFWLHHANVDRIWSIWQAKPENRDKKPTFPWLSPSEADREAHMDPWHEEYNVDNINNLEDLGEQSYVYGPDDCSPQ